MRVNYYSGATIRGISGRNCWRELSAARAPQLRRVINATGVIVHTNLGRAPLAEAALEPRAEIARGYSNLEYDLDAGGARLAAGSRRRHPAPADGRRGRARREQQRGRGAARARRARRGPGRAGLAWRVDRDRRRLPHSGRARAIGRAVASRWGRRTAPAPATTRRRSARRPAVLLRVHQSNFRVVGFTAQPSLGELADVAASSRPAARRRSRVRCALRRRRRADGSREPRPPAPTWSVSPATSCSGDLRPASSSDGPISWRGCDVIHCSVRCAQTS